MNNKFPLKLKITYKPERFSGFMRIDNYAGNNNYYISFDMKDSKAKYEIYIYDRDVMRVDDIIKWTGINLNDCKLIW